MDVTDSGILDRNRRIKAEKLRLTKMFSELSGDQKTLAKKLIDNAAFMAIALEDAANDIVTGGYTEVYKNGEHQYGSKKSAAAEFYNVTMRNYQNVMKELISMLPKQAAEQIESPILKFIQTRPVVTR